MRGFVLASAASPIDVLMEGLDVAVGLSLTHAGTVNEDEISYVTLASTYMSGKTVFLRGFAARGVAVGVECAELPTPPCSLLKT
jgi:hypothetical protein